MININKLIVINKIIIEELIDFNSEIQIPVFIPI